MSGRSYHASHWPTACDPARTHEPCRMPSVNILRHVSFCLPPPLPCALPLGYRSCVPNPDGCGTGEGAACCPLSLFLFGDQEKGIVSNPPTQSLPRPCPDKMFCHNDYWTPSNETIQFTCFLREPKDCGTFGKSCCKKTNPKPRPTERDDGYRSEIWTCGADAGSGGPKGWCDRDRNEPYGLCTPCPAKGQTFDSSVRFTTWGNACSQ